jgi:hypothetical protein
MSASASLSTPRVSIVPGDEGTVTIHVRNSGDIVEAYRFDVLGATAEWATVEPERLSLYPNAAGTAILVLKPPRSPRVPAGEVPFGVRVQPFENPQAVVVPEGMVKVLPFEEIAGELIPTLCRGRLRGRLQVSIENGGNVPITVLLAASDSGQQLRFAHRPAAVEVAPGQTVYANIRIRPRRLLWRGTPHNHAFGVRLAPEDSAPRTLDGTFVQLPLLPAWLLKALALLLALLAALAALWFGLLRPTVRSAAREAAAPAAQAAAKTAVAEQQASAAPQPAAPGASAGPGASGAPAAGAGGGGGAAPQSPPPAAGPGVGPGGLSNDHFSTAINLRTLPGGSATRSFVVPRKKIFWVTDFVVENPQGDEGVVTVNAAGKQVVVIALENFRDQDYHWVTPIRVPARSNVTLSVVCRKPGTPPDSPARTSCAESLYVNGLLRSRG